MEVFFSSFYRTCNFIINTRDLKDVCTFAKAMFESHNSEQKKRVQKWYITERNV